MDKKYAVYLTNNAEHSIGCFLGLGGEFGTLYPDKTLPATNQYVITEIKSFTRCSLAVSVFQQSSSICEITERLGTASMTESKNCKPLAGSEAEK